MTEILHFNDLREVVIQPGFDGKVRVKTERDDHPFIEHARYVRAVTVRADGSIEYHHAETRQEVLDAAMILLAAMYDDSPCRIDHNGECQEHGWIPDPGEACGQVRIRELLTAAGWAIGNGKASKP